jgi:hypothetical protein
MKPLFRTFFPWLTTLVLASSLLFTACEISGSNDVVRQVSLNIAGAYSNSSGIPANQTGNRVTQLSIQQRGDQLDAVDNQGGRWSGSIGRADGTLATFTLKGATSAAQSVTLTGTIVVEGNNGTLTGTWIEPSLQSAASATANVAGVITPTATPAAATGPVATATPLPFPTLSI